jgi:hypothetical protein
MRKICFVILCAILGGCVAPQKISISSPFDPVLTKKLLADGINTIQGSALIRQRGGGVVTCAGQEVTLTPATAYSSERVKALFGSSLGGYAPAFGGRRVEFESTAPEYWSSSRSTICDAQGNFRFDKMADGSFYVNTQITWNVSPYATEGGSITRLITLSGGETKNIVLTP